MVAVPVKVVCLIEVVKTPVVPIVSTFVVVFLAVAYGTVGCSQIQFQRCSVFYSLCLFQTHLRLKSGCQICPMHQ